MVSKTEQKYNLIKGAEGNRDKLNKIVENFRPFAGGKEPVFLVETAIDVLNQLIDTASKGEPLASQASLQKVAALLVGIQQLSDPETQEVATDPDDQNAIKSLQLMAPTTTGAKYMTPVINWALVSAKSQIPGWMEKLARYEQTKDPKEVVRDLTALRQTLQMATTPQRLPMVSGTVGSTGQRA